MIVAGALALGVAVGLVIGTLGGGGSVLTVPVLVFALGLSAQQATTASLVIVGTTAAVAAVGHARGGGTRWRSGALLAAAGVPTSVLGSWLNRRVDDDVLLLAFAVLLLVAAVGMLGGGAGDEHHGARRTGTWRWLAPALAGLAVGALTGFFGVGGGFVLVPVLVLALRFPVAEAIGTSLLVIALNSAVALAARTGSLDVDVEVVVPFTAAAVVASLLGARVSARLPSDVLGRAFGVLLALVAVYTGVRAGTALL